RRRRAHDLLVETVTAGDVDAHRDRLVGLVGDDPAQTLLRAARGRLVHGERRLGGRGRGRLGPLALLQTPAPALRRLALALGGAQACRVLELAGRVLEAQAERLAALGADVLDELGVGEVAQILGLHAASASSRVTTFVRTGSLCPARRMASRASESGTPASSNITRPGLTTATQPSGEPLPEPMRVSAGFFVKGLSG